MTGLKTPVLFASRFDIPSWVEFELVTWHEEVAKDIVREAELVDEFPWTDHEKDIHNYAHHAFLNLVERVKQRIKKEMLERS